MKYSVIYILTNKKNGKRYVGLARKSFKGRLNSHFRNDSYIGKALRKNGLDGFEIQQIAYHKDELNYWERYFIEKLGSRHPGGYNLTAGGDGVVNPAQVVRDQRSRRMKESPKNPDFTFANRHHLDESKKKTSESLKVTMALPEVKARMSASAKSRPLISEETSRKISLSKLGKARTDAHLFSQRMKEFSSLPGYVNPMQGQKRPDLSERNRAGKGRKDSPETLARKSAASKGKEKTESHLQAIRIGKAVSKFAREMTLQ